MNPGLRVILAGVALAAATAAVPATHAAGQAPPQGSWGFDSHKPETTRCMKLGAAQVAKLKACTWSKSNSFGDDRAGWSCRVGKRDGFMAYPTQRDCQAELELERANGD